MESINEENEMVNEVKKFNDSVDTQIKKINDVTNKIIGSNLDESEKLIISVVMNDKIHQLNNMRTNFLMNKLK